MRGFFIAPNFRLPLQPGCDRVAVMARMITAIMATLLLTTIAEAAERATPQTCSYEVRVWNVISRQSIDRGVVTHPYDSTGPAEVDPATGCTVCKEDQSEIRVPPLEPFSVCYKIASRVQAALEELVRRGAPIFAVTGYHVIKSRGSVNNRGDRTEFSNHSFGTAIDINPDRNGLYDQCVKFGPECRLLRGGEWRPGVPGTLERESDVVRAVKAAGFRWGGEIAGKQKDFMHFSPSGY